MSDLPAELHPSPVGPRLAGAAFGHNLAAGLRLALGRRLGAHAFRVSPGHVLLALAVSWGVVVLAEWLAAGRGASFWIWGFVADAARIHAWLAALAIIAWASRRTDGFMTLVIALSYANLPVWLVSRALEHAVMLLAIEPGVDYSRLFYAGVLAWYGLIFRRALDLLRPMRWMGAAGAVAAYVGALVAISEWLPQADLFYQSAAAPPAIDVEATYYRQAGLVDAQLAALAPQVPGRVDVYFVGVGAYSAQDVFMREVRQARAIVEERLGLHGRTVSLINNRETLGSVPLANAPNLERVTARLARIMDRDEDVLVLFITSHGYDDASIAVEFGELGPNDIHAGDLRRILDLSGIRWRVVIVSACYSGSFIEALESPTTLVMTAAAPDRSSFGCSHENAWTYFGRAYFAGALAETRDLIEAFELARARIEERERDEGKTPSLPQISIGKDIGSHLRRWQPAIKPVNRDTPRNRPRP